MSIRRAWRRSGCHEGWAQTPTTFDVDGHLISPPGLELPAANVMAPPSPSKAPTDSGGMITRDHPDGRLEIPGARSRTRSSALRADLAPGSDRMPLRDGRCNDDHLSRRPPSSLRGASSLQGQMQASSHVHAQFPPFRSLPPSSRFAPPGACLAETGPAVHGFDKSTDGRKSRGDLRSWLRLGGTSLSSRHAPGAVNDFGAGSARTGPAAFTAPVRGRLTSERRFHEFHDGLRLRDSAMAGMRPLPSTISFEMAASSLFFQKSGPGPLRDDALAAVRSVAQGAAVVVDLFASARGRR